jgi:hypothetical protein
MLRESFAANIDQGTSSKLPGFPNLSDRAWYAFHINADENVIDGYVQHIKAQTRRFLMLSLKPQHQ